MNLGRISKQQWSVKFQPYLLDDSECDDCYVVTPDGFHIAKIYNPDRQFEQHGENQIATLVSAAPELLEALQIAVRLIATAENNGAYKDCALPLIGKKSLEKMEALLERLK